MDYKELAAKLKRLEPLTAEEVADFDKEFRPTYRMNEVSQKKAEIETMLKQVEAERDKLKVETTEATQKIQDEVNNQLRELSGKVENLSKENSELKTTKAQSETLLKATMLATKNDLGVIFKNPDYLAYRSSKDGVDLNDTEKVKTFLTALQKTEPELFMVAVKGGAGTGSTSTTTTEHENAKPVKDWSSTDKVAFIKENGADAYTQKLASEGE